VFFLWSLNAVANAIENPFKLSGFIVDAVRAQREFNDGLIFLLDPTVARVPDMPTLTDEALYDRSSLCTATLQSLFENESTVPVKPNIVKAASFLSTFPSQQMQNETMSAKQSCLLQRSASCLSQRSATHPAHNFLQKKLSNRESSKSKESTRSSLPMRSATAFSMPNPVGALSQETTAQPSDHSQHGDRPRHNSHLVPAISCGSDVSDDPVHGDAPRIDVEHCGDKLCTSHLTSVANIPCTAYCL